MNEENIFYIEELRNGNGNNGNCNGHFRSIQAGGNGHKVGDSCGCDSLPDQGPSVSIDFISISLLFTAIILIILKLKTK